MKYSCTIKNIEEEYDVTIQINNLVLVGLDYFGISEKEIGKKKWVEIELFDEIKIVPAQKNIKNIKRVGDSFSYVITGILDINKSSIHSLIDFDLSPNILFDYGYLDQKYIDLKILRMDFSFTDK